MTASEPLTTAATSAGFKTSPFTAFTLGSPGTREGSRTTAVTLCPRETSSFKTREPIIPVAPNRTTFIKSLLQVGWRSYQQDELLVGTSSCHCHQRICALIIQKPLLVKEYQPFCKGGAGRILACLLIRQLRFQSRNVGLRQQMRRIPCREKRLACGVCVGSKIRIATLRGVLAVVDNDDASLRQDWRRSGLGKCAVKMPSAGTEQIDWIVVCVFHWRPVNQVRRSGKVNGALAPIHPVFSMDAGSHEPAFAKLCDNSGGLVLQVGILAMRSVGKCRAVLCPVHQIARGRNPD